MDFDKDSYLNQFLILTQDIIAGLTANRPHTDLYDLYVERDQLLNVIMHDKAWINSDEGNHWFQQMLDLQRSESQMVAALRDEQAKTHQNIININHLLRMVKDN